MIRTPSIYSQDDPITEALKPPSTETESERIARLAAEAEAKRISEKIDEDLREERERLRRKKGDVKLLLLGQAESGKSTLQKQFQLMYRPNSLDEESISWKTVIYFNVVHSLKHILTTLDQWDDVLDEDDDSLSHPGEKSRFKDHSSPSMSLYAGGSANGSPSSAAGVASSSNHSHPWTKDSGVNQIAGLRRKLSPLVSTDTQLADRLSGGINVSGSGKGSVYVRSGWQARTIENALGRLNRRSQDTKERQSTSENQVVQDILILDVARMLALFESDIKELWNHPTVKGMIAKRRLKLDEWSEFFLKHIARVAAPDYIPSTGESKCHD